MDIQAALITAVNSLIRGFFEYKPDWIKYLERSTRSGSDRIAQRNFGLDWDCKNLGFVQHKTEPQCRGGHGFGVPESTPAGFCVFLWTRFQAKFLTCYCFSVILLLKVRE